MSASNQEIKDALADKKPDLLADAHQILSTLGYKSKRTIDGIHQPSEFLQQYDPKNGEGVNADELKQHADKIGIVFQVTDEEIREANEPAASEFQRNNERSFFFVAADLKAGHYLRGQLARMTRAVNRCFASPTVVLFRHSNSDAGDAISLSFISRRRSKIDDTKDVLGRVSILRAIRRDDPHRGHLKILQDLTLPAQLQWIKDQSKNLDFDGLLAAWLNTLDTETLNKHFYKALFEWFERAVQQCKFPDSETAGKNEEQVIRMITRMLFIWFIKEKGLVPKELFEESFALDILKKHQPDNSDYYRAVLQNLFFGTLNTPQEDRDFRQRDEHGKGKSDQYRVFNLYRYEDMLKNPQDFVKRLHPVPFVNGGLFDCLDGFETGGYQADRRRIDCFTDNRTHRELLKVPSHLFFDEDKGLFPLFNQFKFTVAENTPLDQEVALDPELLGMVFENLLAAIVPESYENARKQTGSFYTPRPIVEYMVDEALIAYLSGKLEEEAVPKLQQLLSWEDAEGDNELLTSKEKDGIINAIDELRILDPAVGSGAFPMGILHKLVHILSQVDPQNAQWAKMQRERAATITDPTVRKNTMEDIEKIFSGSNNFGDYGRKLYLIQRTIHGADLQAVAAQITRLRFFISLIIDQKPSDNQPNRGIEPLPNLETKFVAADSLIRLERNEKKQWNLAENKDVREYQRKINLVRSEYFTAKTRDKKRILREHDKKLRQKLSNELEKTGFLQSDADRYVEWDLYNQTAQADWFDAELMLGISNDFDIIIGNPPYLESRSSNFDSKKKNMYQEQAKIDWGKGSIPRGSDLLIYFFLRAIQELNINGIGIFIVQNSWLHADYGYKFQKLAIKKFSFLKIIDSAFRYFGQANAPSINTVITSFSPKRGLPLHISSMKNWDEHKGNVRVFSNEELENNEWKWGVLFESPQWMIEVLDSLKADKTDVYSVKMNWGQGINERKNSYVTTKDAEENFGISEDKLHPIFYKTASFDFSKADYFLISAENFEKDELVELLNKNVPVFDSGSSRHIPDLILPRGIGKHYCALNWIKGYSYSGVECRLMPKNHRQAIYSVWALMNSSLIWLYREISGRKNLGGGMLKAEATDMKQLGDWLHIPDIEEAAQDIYNYLRQREPLTSLKEINTPEHRAIDALICHAFDIEEYEDQIRDALHNAIKFRDDKARTAS